MQISDAASCFKGVKENPSNDFRITVSTKTDTYSVRVVRVILKSGEIETLITNLSEEETAYVIIDICKSEMRWIIKQHKNSWKWNCTFRIKMQWEVSSWMNSIEK